MFCRGCQTADYCFFYDRCVIARLPSAVSGDTVAPAGGDANTNSRRAGASHSNGAEGTAPSDQKFDGAAA